MKGSHEINLFKIKLVVADIVKINIVSTVSVSSNYVHNLNSSIGTSVITCLDVMRNYFQRYNLPNVSS